MGSIYYKSLQHDQLVFIRTGTLIALGYSLHARFRKILPTRTKIRDLTHPPIDPPLTLLVHALSFVLVVYMLLMALYSSV